jgi:hypothetical protein
MIWRAVQRCPLLRLDLVALLLLTHRVRPSCTILLSPQCSNFSAKSWQCPDSAVPTTAVLLASNTSRGAPDTSSLPGQ